MWIYPKAWQVLQTRTPEQRALLPQPFLDEWSRLQSFEFRLRAMQLLRDDQWKFVDQRIQFVKTLPSGKVRNYNRAHCGYFPHGNMDISAIRAILEEVLFQKLVSRSSAREAQRRVLQSVVSLHPIPSWAKRSDTRCLLQCLGDTKLRAPRQDHRAAHATCHHDQVGG